MTWKEVTFANEKLLTNMSEVNGEITHNAG